MPRKSDFRHWLDWLWPELKLFETGAQAQKALSGTMLRSGLMPAVFLSAAAIFIAPLDRYFRLVGDRLGHGSVLAELVSYVSILLLGLIPFVIVWLFHGRMRRCIRRELASLGQAICVNCGYDLRSQTAPHCSECGAVFDAGFVGWPRRRLFPELNRFDSAAQAREAWNSALSREVKVYAFAVGVGVALWIIVMALYFEPLSRRLGLGSTWLSYSPPVIVLLIFAIVVWLRRQRIRRTLRERLAQSGVPVCIVCGYDLRGQTVPRCPECGRPFESKTAKGKGDAAAL